MANVLADKTSSTFHPARKELCNFESSKLAQLSKTVDASPSNRNSRQTMGDFTVKHIVQKVCLWFEIWLPWQRRVLLCGITDRCSKRQLEYLATALEPVFHRDFSASLSKDKIHGVCDKDQQEKDSQIALLKALQMATKGTRYEDDYLLLKGRKLPSSNSFEEFVRGYVKQVITGAFDTIHGRSTKSLATTDHLKSPQDQKASIHVHSATTLFVSRIGKLSEDEYFMSEDTSQLIPTVTTDSDQQVERTKSTECTPPCSLGPFHRSLKSPPDDKLIRHGPHWTFPGCQDLQTPLFSSNLGGQVAMNSGTIFTPGYGTGSYVPLQTNKVSTLTWCMKQQRRDLSPASPASSGNRLASHHHNSQVSACSASTQDFFQPAQRTHKLGKMYRALRTGQIRKPDRVTDVSIPLQKSFKNAKWWGSVPSSSRRLVPAHQMELRDHFKKQITQIWEWMQDWEESDKGDLLVELIKMCDQDLVRFTAQCLQQRLRDRNDINYLPDKLLLHIFTFLSPRDIAMAERVCRRWRYIAAQDVLWKLKCQEMGDKEGLINLPGLIEEFNQGCSVDWRSAYTELCLVALNAKAPPTPVMQVGETGTKKWLSIKFSDLVKKRMPSSESVKISPIKSESLSSEESSTEDFDRRNSKVVDVPVHFVQTVVPVKEMEEDVIEELTLSEFAMQGIAPDFDLFPELTPADISALVPTALAADIQLPLLGKTQKKDILEDKGTKEGGDIQAVKEADDKKGKKKKKKEKKTKSQEDDIALDIRPELLQAKDILGELKDVSVSTKPLKHPGWVKPIKRVRRLQGHTDAVCCLMFDKWRIVTGSMDRTIRVWDIRSGRSIHRIYGHKGGIRCLQFDDTRIVSGSWDMTVMVWDIVKFNNLATLTGHLDVISCLQFDKRHLVTGSHDKTIRVWSMDDYCCVQVLRHHRDSVTCLVFDGCFVTSGSADRTIQMTRISTGECILKLTEYLDAVTSLDVQGDLIVAGTMSGKLFFWDKLSGEVVAGVQPHDSTVFKIVFLPRGGRGGARFITAAGDGSIKEWDLYSMTCVRVLHGHQGVVRDVKVSGDRIVSCSDDGNIRIWDLLTPSLRLGDKGEDDTIETKTIDQRKEA